MLQQERWGFVQKFRAAKQQAGDAGKAALDGLDAGVDMDEEEDESDGDADDDDADSDW